MNNEILELLQSAREKIEKEAENKERSSSPTIKGYKHALGYLDEAIKWIMDERTH